MLPYKNCMHNRSLSYRHIFVLSLPAIAANVTLPLQGLIDVAIIGHLDSPEYLSAVGLAAQLFALLFVSFNFLQYATSGLCAQATGATDHVKLKRILWRALLIALGLSILLIASQWLWRMLGHWFFATQGNIQHLFDDYYHIRIWSAPWELANYVFIGWFAGQGKPSALFRQQLTISLSNLLLNALFVIGLGWGVTGVALGTLLANMLGTIYALQLVKRQLHIQGQSLLPKNWQRLLHRAEISKLLQLNRDIWVRTVILTLAFAWVMRLSAQQGERILAANVILLQLLTIAAFAIDGIAVTTESQVGQAYGRNDSALLRLAVWRTSLVALITASFISLAFVLIQPLYLYIMTDLPAVARHARQYYLFAAFIPLIAVFAYQFDGVLFGLTANTQIRNSMLLVALLFFPISYFLPQFWGNSGVWLALYWFFILRGGILWWQYRRIAQGLVQ